MKKPTVNWRILRVSFTCLLVSVFTVSLSADGQASLDAVSHLRDKMELDNMWTNLGIHLGHAIYSGLAYLNDLVEGAFNQIVSIDLFKEIPALAVIQKNIELSLGVIFVLVLAGVLITRMLSMREPYSAFFNAVIVALAIIVFSFFVGIVDDGRIAFLGFINATVSDGTTTSESTFMNNTYDLKYLIDQSLAGNKIDISIAEQGIPSSAVSRIQYDERMTKGEFGYKDRWNEKTGQFEAVRVADGWSGWGDERYYRWHTNYFEVNVSLAISFFVFISAILKAGNLVVDLTLNRQTGKLVVAGGTSDLRNAAKPYMSFLQTTLSILILAFLVQIYTAFSAGILAIPDATLGFAGKCMLLFMFGMIALMGSDYLDGILGFASGRRTLATMGAMYASARMAKGGYNAAKNLGNKAKDAGKGMANWVSDQKEKTEKMDKENEDASKGLNESPEDKVKDHNKDGDPSDGGQEPKVPDESDLKHEKNDSSNPNDEGNNDTRKNVDTPSAKELNREESQEKLDNEKPADIPSSDKVGNSKTTGKLNDISSPSKSFESGKDDEFSQSQTPLSSAQPNGMTESNDIKRARRNTKQGRPNGKSTDDIERHNLKKGNDPS